MASKPVSLRIVDGPSKLGLFLAFLDHKPDGQDWRDILFTMKDTKGEKVIGAIVVQAVQFEDGSGESWCLKGSLRYLVSLDRVGATSYSDFGTRKVDIYFSTKNRTGTMTVIGE